LIDLDDLFKFATIAVMNKPWLFLLAVVALISQAPGLYAAGFDALLPLMVDLPGWEAEKADGADMSASGMRAVTVYRSYQSGDRTFEASILIGTQASSTWMPDYKEGYRMETPEGLLEVKKINGFLVFSSFENEGGSGGIVVLLQNAASTSDTGAVLAISFEGLAREEALKMAQLFNWAKMKEQVARLK
jgi:hypothetical protein